MVAVLVLCRRWRAFMAIKAIHNHLKTKHNSVEGVLIVTKIKYDEMSIKVRVAQHKKVLNPGGESDATEPGDHGSSHKDPGNIKLLNIAVWYAALWEVDGKFVAMQLKGACTIRPIERNNTECLREAMLRQCEMPADARFGF